MYRKIIKLLFKDIQIIPHDEKNRVLSKLDEGYKMMFKAFVYNGIPYSKVVEKKITLK